MVNSTEIPPPKKVWKSREISKMQQRIEVSCLRGQNAHRNLREVGIRNKTDGMRVNLVSPLTERRRIARHG